jgi:hemolysin activation/secretion protein
MKRLLITAIFVAAAPCALAQPTGGGGQLRQIPPAPAQPRSLPDIRVERGTAPAAVEVGGTRVIVRSLHVAGATQFSEAELIAASGFQPGLELDLAGLRLLASRISDFYNRHGFFVAQAYLPAQGVEDGAVTIAIVEGHYGKVALDNRAPVSGSLARSLLAGLDPGDIVETAPLERRLLLLSDLPGVDVASTLTPGEAVGTSNLVVALTPGRRVTGSLEGDNAGNPYTGLYRGGGAINFNEPFGQGDVASVRVLTAGSGLTYVRGAYEAHIQAATVGVAYTHLSYELGRQFSALDAHGTVKVASIYGSYPLIRSRRANLEALALYEDKSFRDKVGATGFVVDRSVHVATLGFAGDATDHLWAGGWTTYSVGWGIGDLDIETPLARATDALTARTNGHYNKVSFDVARLQGLRGPFSLYAEVRGQIASKNLDSAEKMELGGAYGVRAYPEGEAYGDEGYILTAEARARLARLSQKMGGQVEAIAFVDNGSVRFNKDPWAAGHNRRTLSAAGVGLKWTDPGNLVVSVSYAVKLGNERATSAPDHSGRAWVQVSKFF